MEQHPWTIEWDDRFSIGIPEIDADHKTFCRLVRELGLSLMDRERHDRIEDDLDLIIAHTRPHFTREEYLLSISGYSNIDHHVLKHAETLGAVENIMKNAGAGASMDEWVEMGIAVKDALIDHFRLEDTKFARFYGSVAGPRARPESASAWRWRSRGRQEPMIERVRMARSLLF